LTKHDIVESGLKCSLTPEDAEKAGLNVNDLVKENVTKLYSPRVFVEEAPKLKAVQMKKKRAAKRSRLSRIIQKLYNLESGNEPEKHLHIELNLYQMENY
jgi:hypothetical protein